MKQVLQSTKMGRVLVIASSDSSGGAGLEADQKVITAHGCYAMTATTALTAQNTLGVEDINVTPPDFIRKQIEACVSDIGVDAVKTGMLASSETIKAVAGALFNYNITNIVVDPVRVMISTSGTQLLPTAAVKDLRRLLLPLSKVLTPNIPEAELLLSDCGTPYKELKCIDDLIGMAKAIHALGPEYVLLKGGHVPLKEDGTVASQEAEKRLVVDILYGNDEVIRLDSTYQDTKNTHGTGCSLASAIASNLAHGLEVSLAVKAACRYVEAGIRTAINLGHGSGPINHFHSLFILPFSPGRFLEYLLDRPDVEPAWEDYTKHSFVAGLADGTLPLEVFKHYLVQDYLYLVHFARANALAAYKAKNMDDIVASANIVASVKKEMDLHIKYCEGFGISKDDMDCAEESQACTAYSRYVLDIGHSEDFLALHVSMAPCIIGYGLIAKQLHDNPKTKRVGNIYWDWIESYVTDEYKEVVKISSELLERHARLQSPSRIEELVKIFVNATKMETCFWGMGLGEKQLESI